MNLATQQTEHQFVAHQHSTMNEDSLWNVSGQRSASGSEVEHTQGYAGDVSPREAWDLLTTHDQACLVDVRSEAEWGFVGICDLSSLSKHSMLCPLMSFPGMQPNAEFAEDVSAQLTKNDIDKDAPLLFICRSGQRSISAAKLMTALGYSQCLNVLEGFEGNLDGQAHRGVLSGWKVAGLPWQQQ